MKVYWSEIVATLMVISVLTVPLGFYYYQEQLYPSDTTVYVFTRQWEFIFHRSPLYSEALRLAPGTKELVVQQGTLVRLLIWKGEVVHGFAIEGYNLTVVFTNGSRRPNVTDVVVYPGEPVLVEFLVDKPGTFWIRCTVQCHPVMHWYHRSKLIVSNGTTASYV